jgi:hypothetical protein
MLTVVGGPSSLDFEKAGILLAKYIADTMNLAARDVVTQKIAKLILKL